MFGGTFWGRHDSTESRDEAWLRASLAVVWLWTALAVFHPHYREVGRDYLSALGLPDIVMYGTCACELVLGLWVLLHKTDKFLFSVQAALVFSFTVILALHSPLLLASPFGFLSKNLQFLCVLWVSFVLTRDRVFTPRTLHLLRFGMAFVWFTEGLFPKLLFQQPIELQMVPQMGISGVPPSWLIGFVGVCQILSGVLALLLKGKPLRVLLLLQTIALVFLPVAVFVLQPRLLFHPFGAFCKNVPILVGTWIVRKRCGGLH